MTDVTNILGQIEEGDPSAADKLLPLVYDELKKLAAARMVDERSDHTLQATALVHEAYLRLVNVEKAQHWNSRGHFFGAAAEAMRRILVENARRKLRLKRGGDVKQLEFEAIEKLTVAPPDELIAIDDAIDTLAQDDPEAAELVKLRYFAGLSIEKAAELIGLSRSTAYEHWAYAKAWLKCEILGSDDSSIES
jgi:RNA polymerase sigma factor (TIGR02999 family)